MPRSKTTAGRRTVVIAVAAVLSLIAQGAALADSPGFGAGGPADGPGGSGSPLALNVFEGVGVSHWQGTIAWPSVAAAGYRFAFMKATEDIDFVDPMYATNYAGAKASGMWVGAYHFAQPDASNGDARREADHYLATAELIDGDIVPILDMEDSGGLDQATLTAWIMTWLNRVRLVLDVKPLLYTGNYFWNTYVGGTTAVADAGYTLLDIAHWNVPKPNVPANDWAGASWSVWQYSPCGTVPGIEGCTNMNHMKASRANLLTVP